MGDGPSVDEMSDDATSTDPETAVEWSAPSEALVPVRPQGSTYYVGGASSGWRVAAVIGLLIAGLLIVANVALWQKIDDVEGDVSGTRESVTATRGVVGAEIAPLEETVSGLEQSVSDLQASVGTATTDVGAQVAAVQARVDTVVACLNTYMDVISRWSTNTGSPYVYDRC